MQLTSTNVATMDVHMLMSIINLKLRNEFSSLTEMCQSYDIEQTALEARLKEGDYVYDEGSNQLR